VKIKVERYKVAFHALATLTATSTTRTTTTILFLSVARVVFAPLKTLNLESSFY